MPATGFTMTVDSAGAPSELSVQLMRWANRVGLARKLAFALTAAAILSGIATYAALTGSPPLGPDPDTVLLLLNVDLVVLLLLGTVIARRIVQVWAERRRGSAGSRLHVRLVLLFSLVAVTPAIAVSVFSVLFFDFGVQAWFSERVRTALKESLAVTEAYLDEHQQNIRSDVLAMGNDLRRESLLSMQDPGRFQQFVAAQAALRSLSEALIFDAKGRVFARSGLTFALEFEPLPIWALEKARNGEIAILTSEADDRVRALVQLDPFLDTFLIVGRFVEPGVLGHIERTQTAVAIYEQLEGRRSGLQITFVMIFTAGALLLLLAAIWVGLTFATRLVRPISRLITATEQVRAGDLTVRVADGPDTDEIGSLNRAFNRMTSQLATQRSELVEANRQLDIRRRFTETVLEGVSAGVIGLDRAGRINLLNRSASRLLSVNVEQLIGQKLAKALPEMAELIESARRHPLRLVQSQIKITRSGHTRTLLVRIAAERVDDEAKGFVVTFDDVTKLLTAQRQAAWADVARRIAHEIKNPLTPIQLSAERLKRKYLKQIKSDPEIFKACTDIIVQQVGDIERMVDEFSAFARMPAPIMKSEDLSGLCRQAIFLQQSAHPDIAFSVELPDRAIMLRCDGRQLGQALTNLLQNAIDSILSRESSSTSKPPPGSVVVRVAEPHQGRVVIEIEDNGTGFPSEERDQYTEPYVTTRSNGTGLGLAIVKKIMEDHGADLALEDREGGGARVRLVFDAGEDAGEDQAPQDETPSVDTPHSPTTKTTDDGS